MFRGLVIASFWLAPLLLAAQSQVAMLPDTLWSRQETMMQGGTIEGTGPQVGNDLPGVKEEEPGQPTLQLRFARPGYESEPWELRDHAGDIAIGLFEWLFTR